MRYTTRQYAEALRTLALEIHEKDIPALAKKFVSTIKRHGAQKQIPDILKTTLTLNRREHGGRSIAITAFDEASLETAVKDFSPHDDITGSISKKTVGGVSITIDGTRIDNTLRRRLDDLKRTIS